VALLLGLAACSSSSAAGTSAAGAGSTATASTGSGGGGGSGGGPAGGAGGGASDAGAPVDGGGAAYWTAECVNHTVDDRHCKDCCDCAPIGCTELTPCRNACKLHDFSQNETFITVDVPSTKGPDGGYGACVAQHDNGPDCKTCCECQMGLACGDFQYCRTLCDVSYDAGPKPP
jgi:hypothetical protein